MAVALHCLPGMFGIVQCIHDVWFELQCHLVGTISVKNPSRGESPGAGEAIAPVETMAELAAVRFVFIDSRQSCGELKASPLLIVLRRTMQQSTR